MPPPSIWRDIAADLRRRVEAGEWAVGERIPSVRELMAQYETPTQGALVRAISTLANEGVLLTDPHAPRRGVRVRARMKLSRPIDQHFAAATTPKDRTLEQIHSDDLDNGDDFDVDISYDRAPAADVADLLGAELGDEPVLVRTFRYLLKGTPHQLVRSRMSDKVAQRAGLRSPDDEVSGKSTETWLRDAGIEPHHISMTVESRLPTADEAAELAMPTALPVMVRKRTVIDKDGAAVEASTSLVVADQIIYTAEFDLEAPC
ncbi:GntR family transcriptional regulator [Nocardia sp. NBC_00508]|uniref:GntR family transcriptional regulator n=1 Tax=Nocardia sp. NBC_00508 TaxID=2975992 RepID=UPI002E817801|nr:GntR family transcriptional regulator [Nocardia sp. NBC_00508]WUD69627.1 GntR family transcriptional regulator [Nocardia sp. NBC_00508]